MRGVQFIVQIFDMNSFLSPLLRYSSHESHLELDGEPAIVVADEVEEEVLREGEGPVSRVVARVEGLCEGHVLRGPAPHEVLLHDVPEAVEGDASVGLIAVEALRFEDAKIS